VQARVRAAGSLVVQLAQALGSFIVQLVVARQLGLDGLAVFALLYGVLVLGSGVVTGLVGDSLTVLDRANPGVRAALQWWALVSCGGVAVVGGLSTLVLDASVDRVTALWFAVASLLFTLEEVGRRLLMAVLAFWSVVAADLVAIVCTVGVLVWFDATVGMSLSRSFLAIGVGQAAALMAVVAVLPSAERRWAPVRHSVRDDRARVWAYGSWRAVQQLFRPTTLTAVRAVSIAAVGAVAFGRMEASRIVIAPAIHVVTGLSNYLFAGYARTQDAPMRTLIRTTDRRVVPMVAMVGVIGAIAVLGAPMWGRAMVGSADSLTRSGLCAWACYAAATAAGAPYSALAAARGEQRAITLVRLAEAVASIALAAVILAAGGEVWWPPVTMSLMTALAAAAVRRRLLAPASASARAQRSATAAEPSASIGS
jgi:hypothetical protein